MLLVILTMKKLLERSTKKNCKRQMKQSLEWKKVIKKNGHRLYVKLKAMIIHLIAGLIKMILNKYILHKMSEYLPKL